MNWDFEICIQSQTKSLRKLKKTFVNIQIKKFFYCIDKIVAFRLSVFLLVFRTVGCLPVSVFRLAKLSLLLNCLINLVKIKQYYFSMHITYKIYLFADKIFRIYSNSFEFRFLFSGALWGVFGDFQRNGAN